jgi:hypothetical protein
MADVTWLYQHVVEHSWLSLATAPLVFAGYWLLGLGGVRAGCA